MHLIKNDHYYLAFNKNTANTIINDLKTKTLCVLDFEAFQLPKWAKEKFDRITINDIPYTVCLNTLTFDEQTQEFISTNEVVYQFSDDWTTQAELLEKLSSLGIFISNYVKSHKIDSFIFMADYLEKSALHFLSSSHEIELDLKEYLQIKYFDLYKYFFTESNYKILSYVHKPQHLLKTIMSKYGDEYDNFEIGRDGMRHFAEVIKGRKSNILDFELVRKHSLIDLKKGTDLLNYLVILANWPDSETINFELLQNEIF